MEGDRSSSRELGAKKVNGDVCSIFQPSTCNQHCHHMKNQKSKVGSFEQHHLLEDQKSRPTSIIYPFILQMKNLRPREWKFLNSEKELTGTRAEIINASPKKLFVNKIYRLFPAFLETTKAKCQGCIKIILGNKP